MNDTEKKPRALEVLDSDGSLVFSIEYDGAIYLKEQKIGESKEVADIFFGDYNYDQKEPLIQVTPPQKQSKEFFFESPNHDKDF